MTRGSSIALVVVVLLAVVGVGAVRSSGEEGVLLRLDGQGGGMVTQYRSYELRTDGSLILSRRQPSGKLTEKRVVNLDEDAMQRYQNLLSEGRYFEGSSEALESELAQRAAREWTDVPSYRMEVLRDGRTVAKVIIPPRVAERLHPELREIPFVRVAWTILDEFQQQWDTATRVDP